MFKFFFFFFCFRALLKFSDVLKEKKKKKIFLTICGKNARSEKKNKSDNATR